MNSPELERAIAAVGRAASSAGDVSGNCDEAAHYIERGNVDQAAQSMEWAETNVRSALYRITEARAAIAKATGSAS